MNHISYNTKSNFVPDHLVPYYLNEVLVPEDKDFYGALSPIKKVAVRIFRDRSINRNGDIRSEYTVRSCVVMLTTKTEVLKIGIHLFPILRIKRPLPLVELHVKDKLGNKTTLNLPEIQLRQLTRYLDEGKPHLKFTCGEFLTFLFGYPEIYGSLNFKRLPFEPSKIVAGDGVILYGVNSDFLHEALYLGEDLYLWHCGPTCLSVSTYQEMMYAYKAAQIQILRPHQNELPIPIDLYSTNLLVDIDKLDYYQNKRPVPDEVDFYRGVAPITQVEIEINLQQKIDCNASDAGTQFQLNQAAVIFKTANEILRLGLHLFPTMRVKRKLPNPIMFVVDDTGNRKPLTMPYSILEKLSKFFEEGKPNLQFFGFEFVNYIHGIPLEPIVTPFTLSVFEEEKIATGDALALFRDRRAIHMALYIGNGLYLWHVGACSLAVSTLQSMKNAYQASDLRIARLYALNKGKYHEI